MTKRSCLFRFNGRKKLGIKRADGAAITETIIVFPVLFFVGMAIVHLALIAQAKSNLDYAALMAARIAASEPNFGLNSDGTNRMEDEILKRMGASDSLNDISDPCQKAYREIKICILSPNNSMFDDFGQVDTASGGLQIPNDNLPFRPVTTGGNSSVSVQDANVLHIKVGYRFDSGVPGMKMFSPGMLSDGATPKQVLEPGNSYDAPIPQHEIGNSCNGRSDTNGVYLVSHAAVVMQTGANLNNITRPYVRGAHTDPFCD